MSAWKSLLAPSTSTTASTSGTRPVPIQALVTRPGVGRREYERGYVGFMSMSYTPLTPRIRYGMILNRHDMGPILLPWTGFLTDDGKDKHLLYRNPHPHLSSLVAEDPKDGEKYVDVLCLESATNPGGRTDDGCRTCAAGIAGHAWFVPEFLSGRLRRAFGVCDHEGGAGHSACPAGRPLRLCPSLARWEPGSDQSLLPAPAETHGRVSVHLDLPRRREGPLGGMGLATFRISSFWDGTLRVAKQPGRLPAVPQQGAAVRPLLSKVLQRGCFIALCD